jgi:carboxyl-terminal processing protease
MSRSPAIVKAFVLAGSVTAAGLMAGAHIGQSAMAAGADPYRSLDTLANALHHVQAQYLDEVDPTDLIYGAIGGLMDVLDQHSRFLDPAELEANETRTEGVYSGIGIEMKVIRGAVTVVRIVPGAPADGILEAGDTVAAIDGEVMANLPDTSNALKGEAGTAMVLEYKRQGVQAQVELTRERIRDKTVRVTNLGKGWALAEIVRFQRNTATDLARGIRSTAPKKGLIMDLRGNGGGLLDEAVDVVDLFASSGLIVQTRGRGGTVLERRDASPSAPHSGLKIIVLIDGESASASEIVAGALRSLVGATLVGTETYGKWSVQRVYVFEDKSAIKLTVAQYEIANTTQEEGGLKPDRQVERPSEHGEAIARLRTKLTNDATAQQLLDELESTASQNVVHPPLGSIATRLTQDTQLATAWTMALANH